MNQLRMSAFLLREGIYSIQQPWNRAGGGWVYKPHSSAVVTLSSTMEQFFAFQILREREHVARKRHVCRAMSVVSLSSSPKHKCQDHGKSFWWQHTEHNPGLRGWWSARCLVVLTIHLR